MTTQLCFFLLCTFGVLCVLGVKSFSLAPRVAALSLVALFVGNSASAPQEPKHYFLGFDRNDYPGDKAMKLLRHDFAFTGYWLGNPPGETTNSWSGKRELLRSERFGFVLLFAGPTSGQLREQRYTRKRVADDTQAAAAAA